MTAGTVSRKRLCLALQGGGSHAAFQWGVIERLVEDGRIEISAITGASAGAMNGVAYAAGLIRGGPAGGVASLEGFWRAVNQAGGRNIFGDNAVWSALAAPLDWFAGLART